MSNLNAFLSQNVLRNENEKHVVSHRFIDENKNPITEFAMIVYNCETFEEKFRFETFVKPYDNLLLEEAALKHTGINREMLKDGIEIDSLDSAALIFARTRVSSLKVKKVTKFNHSGIKKKSNIHLDLWPISGGNHFYK